MLGCRVCDGPRLARSSLSQQPNRQLIFVGSFSQGRVGGGLIQSRRSLGSERSSEKRNERVAFIILASCEALLVEAAAMVTYQISFDLKAVS